MSDTIEKIKSLPNNNSMRYLQNRHETDFCECADAGFSTDDLIRLAEALEAAEGALKRLYGKCGAGHVCCSYTDEIAGEALTKIAEAKK